MMRKPNDKPVNDGSSSATSSLIGNVPSALRGFFLLIFVFSLLLSLVSYAYHSQLDHNILGFLGHTIGWFGHLMLGLGSYLLCLYGGWIAWCLFFSKPIEHKRLKKIALLLLLFSFSILLSLVEDSFPSFALFLRQLFYPGPLRRHMNYHLGGAPFYFLYRDLPLFNLHYLLNATGVAFLFSSLFVISLFSLMPFNFTALLPQTLFSLFRKKENSNPQEIDELSVEKSKSDATFDPMRYVKLRIPEGEKPSHSDQHIPLSSRQELLAIQPETHLTVRPSLSRKEIATTQEIPFSLVQEMTSEKKEKLKATAMPAAPIAQEKPVAPVAKESNPTKREETLQAQRLHNGDFALYKLPPPSLLTNAKKVDQSSLKKGLRRQAEVLEETLQSFGIEAKVGQINCGPTITSFEVHPAIGVKVQKIRALENDIALNMEAKSIRIIAPIPGKAAIGIEVPNAHPQEVGFKEMLQAYQQGEQKFHIPILLGKAVNGDYVMNDLTKMPHCIIAGATGSGKSVCINTIVMSILLNGKPDEIKLVMVDPKKVELTPYTKLPHMLAPVITEPREACAALNWLVKEMENRYEILKQLGVRNIEAFNNRTINKALEEALDLEIPPKMPYIVGIIDELADLMMVAASDIETPIARIAQMARAVGIHLILATQRPSREVITGLIKANFPTRISFKVASRVNSQIILDEIGAESLLGNGDMLFLPPGSSQLIRAQGAFIRDADINATVTAICNQAPPNYLINSFGPMAQQSEEEIDGNKAPTANDSLYSQALDIVLSTNCASTTFLQRKLKIGYARAASLIDELEANGVITPADGSKPRKVIYKEG